MEAWRDELRAFQEHPGVDTAAALDARGWLAAPGEDLNAFGARLNAEERKIRAFQEQLEREKIMEPYQGLVIDAAAKISPEILDEGAEITRNAYGFAISFVPGFFPVKGLGLLWGGCTISATEDLPAFFILRRAFAKKSRFLIYSRKELVAHELCHAARAPLSDAAYEEHFAYALSSSALRRYTGNCFKSEQDVLLFLLPCFLLLVVQLLRSAWYPALPVWPFWILIFIWPAWLLAVNAAARKRCARAEAALRPHTNRPGAVLFRCTAAEIDALARIADEPGAVTEFLTGKKETDLRWRIIRSRFINNPTDDT